MYSVIDEMRVLDSIQRHLPVAFQKKLTLDTLLFKEEILDSMGIIQMLSDLEKKFGVAFEDHHLDSKQLASPRQIAVLITQLASTSSKS